MIPVVLEDVHYTWDEQGDPLFAGLDVEMPEGMVSLMGENGTGKSSFLLLAGGVLLPQKGRVLINGLNSASLRDETVRHEQVSFIYQNLEFESEEPIQDLLQFVHDNGFHQEKDPDLLDELVRVFELERILGKRTGEVSKGELQRTILAFSLLYGSPIVMMDEPVFAMEDGQKRRAFEFLVDYARRNQVSIYYSVHELELSQEYSEETKTERAGEYWA